MLFKPKPGKPGDELTWYWLNRLLKWCQLNEINVGPNSGLTMTKSTVTGTTLAWSGIAPAGQLAVCNGGIDACVANSTPCTNSGGNNYWAPGTGDVFFLNYNGTCWVEDNTQSVPVLN